MRLAKSNIQKSSVIRVTSLFLKVIVENSIDLRAGNYLSQHDNRLNEYTIND